MFVIFEQLGPAFHKYRRSPYMRILLIVVAVHVMLFVLTPPFHFKPYVMAAQDSIVVVHIDDIVVPPEPPKEIQPPYNPLPFPDPEAPDRDQFISSPERFEELLKIRVRSTPVSNGYVPWDKPPVAITLVRPKYPALARQAGIEGVVQVQVTIGINGRILKARVYSSDVTPAMDRAAVRAAFRCVFEPAEQQGKPVMVTAMIPFEFRLTN